MKKYYIESLGCPKNLVDSEVFAGILCRSGYAPTPDMYQANLVLVNTCAFLQSALAEFDEVLTEFAEMKQTAQIDKLIVTGCVMNRALEDFIDLFPEVDAWIGLKDFAAFEQFLGKEPNTDSLARKSLDRVPYAYLRISDGCNNYCSYCTIPSIRGDLNSVPIETLVREAEALAKRGAKELVLVAQDSCLYGSDLYGRKALPELIEALMEVKGIKWFRLLYLHPDHYEMEWLELFKKHPRLLPYFEIPIQHSEDRILKAMNRVKGRKELLELFRQIKQEVPEAVFRTTLITGFPGETPAEHKALLSFLDEVYFLHLGVFIYSAEPGTPAYDMPRKVGEKTAEKRLVELLDRHRELASEDIAQHVGSTMDVLIENEMELDDPAVKGPLYLGRAWFQAPEIDGMIVISKGRAIPGQFARVRIDDAIDVDLFGSVVKEKQ